MKCSEAMSQAVQRIWHHHWPYASYSFWERQSSLVALTLEEGHLPAIDEHQQLLGLATCRLEM
jgi:hypothetical protein